MSELPPGFVLDHLPDSGLPPGFVLDKVGLGEDMAKSTAAGLGSATISTLGGAGDVSSLLARGSKMAGDYIGGKLGFEPSPEVSSHTLLPTSKDIRSTVTDPIVDPDYKPQTAWGGLAKTGAEFLPGMIGGPEGIGGKLLTRLAVPAALSEGAGALTEGTAAEPWARAAGALAGGVGASMAAQKFKAMAAARAAESALPTGERLLKTGGDQFNQARDLEVVVKPDFATNAAADMRQAIKGFDPEAHRPLFAAADRLGNLAESGAVPMNEIENIRKQLTSLKTSPDGSIRAGAKTAIESLQKSQMALTPAETLAGDASLFTQLTKEGVGNWAAGKRSQTIQGKMNLAELNANSPVGMLDSATGGQALQRTMKQLARPVNNTNMPVARKLGFNNEEVSAITEAASGTKMQHAAELMDRLVPAKLAAIPAMIARQIGGLTTKRQVAALDSLVRSRSPLAQAVAAQVNPQIIAQLPARTQRLLQATAPARNVAANQFNQPAPVPAPQPPTAIKLPTPPIAAQTPQRPMPPQAPPIFAKTPSINSEGVSPQSLVVARKMPDGTVKVGKPGQIHADLMNKAELNTVADTPDVAASMGYANSQGKFLTRQEALDFALRNEPARAAWSAQQPQFGLDAATYGEATQPRGLRRN